VAKRTKALKKALLVSTCFVDILFYLFAHNDLNDNFFPDHEYHFGFWFSQVFEFFTALFMFATIVLLQQRSFNRNRKFNEKLITPNVLLAKNWKPVKSFTKIRGLFLPIHQQIVNSVEWKWTCDGWWRVFQTTTDAAARSTSRTSGGGGDDGGLPWWWILLIVLVIILLILVIIILIIILCWWSVTICSTHLSVWVKLL